MTSFPRPAETSDDAERLRELLTALLGSGDRPAAARELAGHLGADELFALVRDPELELMLPAPGFPGRLPGGEAWRALLERARDAGGFEARVPPLGGGAPIGALVRSTGRAAAVLLGGAPRPDRVGALGDLLPLLGAALLQEQAAHTAAGERAASRAAAQRAEELARTLDGTRRDLAEALARAEALNRELEDRDHRKDEFLAMLSHELRNPLSAISMGLELVERRAGRAGPGGRSPGGDEELAIVRRQVRHLTRLVDDLLDVSRITRGRIELQCEVHDLRDVVGRARDAARHDVEAKGQALEVRLPAGALPVDGDPVRLMQVVLNLLSNASRYSPEGSRIELEAAREGHEAVASVRDQGQGIPTEVVGDVFDLFVQAPRSAARSEGGLGIGLTVVRSLVEMHGGRVRAESAGPGRGSRFTVRLPLAAALPPASAGARDGRAGEERGSGEGLRVLVVEDHEDTAAFLRTTLQRLDHDVRVAHDGPSGLREAIDGEVDLVVLDVGLPGIDGLELARRIRERRPTLRIVCTSGYGDSPTRERAARAGVDAFLVKPIDLDELRRALGA